MKTDFTDEQRANLTKLADYLDAMPGDYARNHFAMGVFMACVTNPDDLDTLDGDDSLSDALVNDVVPFDAVNDPFRKLHNQKANSQYACGTCACAIGHGPAAGIATIGNDTTWDRYSARVFGVRQAGWEPGDRDDTWEFMFGPDNPDDPQAAAARIREVLSGVPAH